MSDNETKETQVAEETQNTVATESNNEDRKGRRGQRGEGRRGERRNRREENHGDEMLDRVVTINRVSKTPQGVAVPSASPHWLWSATATAPSVSATASPVRSRRPSPRASSTPRSTCSLCLASAAPSPTRVQGSRRCWHRPAASGRPGYRCNRRWLRARRHGMRRHHRRPDQVDGLRHRR